MSGNENGTPTFESRVNEVVSSSTVDDKGNLVLAEGVEADESVLFAAKQVKRFRDTQSAFTKSQQKVKTLEAENDKLATSWEQDAVANLSSSEQARLEELKTQDPDAWRTEISDLEADKRTKFKEKRAAITQEASQLTELERRALQLEQFNKDNPNVQITDEVIENDIPPRITRKLESGEIQFDEYLEEVKTYLGKGKKLAPGVKPEEAPNFAGSRGSTAPTPEAIAAQNSSDYSKEIF